MDICYTYTSSSLPPGNDPSVLLKLINEQERHTQYLKNLLHFFPLTTSSESKDYFKCDLNTDTTGAPLNTLGNNWAFIDMQNLYRGVQWRIHWRSFFEYLKKEHQISKAVIFMGYIKENKKLYRVLVRAGFTLKFRKVKKLIDGTIDGGNVDADLTGYVMDNKQKYNQAIIIADDGDYCNTLRMLKRQNKLKLIISSHSMKYTSGLIKEKIGEGLILSIQSIQDIIEYKPKFY